MDQFGIGSDSSRIESTPTFPEPDDINKKRTYDRIDSNVSSEIEFFDSFDFDKKKVKNKSDYPTNQVLEKIFVHLPEKEEDIINIQEETDVVQVAGSTQNPCIWINKLKYYPVDNYLDNMISFRELLLEDLGKAGLSSSKNSLHSIFMTALKYDIQLLEPLLKERIQITIACETESKSETVVKNMMGYQNFTLIELKKNQFTSFVGSIHSNLMILKFDKFLRVIVCSGCPTALDWSVWSNLIWFQDFPSNKNQNKITWKKPRDDEFDFNEDFKNTLKSYVHHLMPKSTNYSTVLGFNLDNYLFSNIDVILISSVPGRARDKEMDKHGHRKIGSIVKNLTNEALNLGRKPKYSLTYQTSSLANLNDKFIKEICSSLFPNFIDLDQLRSERRYQKILTESTDDLFKRIKIIYPSKKYVETSIEGQQYSGSLTISSDCYDNESFPKNVFYQYKNPGSYMYYEGLIPHSNLFVVNGNEDEIDDNSYIYFGSHGFTSSAWGKYEKDYNQLAICSYELGILIPPGKDTAEKKMKLINQLPFQIPSKRYDKGDVPWISQIHFKSDQPK